MSINAQSTCDPSAELRQTYLTDSASSTWWHASSLRSQIVSQGKPRTRAGLGRVFVASNTPLLRPVEGIGLMCGPLPTPGVGGVLLGVCGGE